MYRRGVEKRGIYRFLRHSLLCLPPPQVSDIFQFYTLSTDMPNEDVEQTLGSTAYGNNFRALGRGPVVRPLDPPLLAGLLSLIWLIVRRLV